MHVLLHEPTCKIVAKLPQHHCQVLSQLQSKLNGFEAINAESETALHDELAFLYGQKQIEQLYHNCYFMGPQEPLDLNDPIELIICIAEAIKTRSFYLPLLDVELIRKLEKGMAPTFMQLAEKATPTKRNKTKVKT